MFIETGAIDGAFWKRQANVGLAGGFGRVVIGRSFTTTYDFMLPFDPMGYAPSYSWVTSGNGTPPIGAAPNKFGMITAFDNIIKYQIEYALSEPALLSVRSALGAMRSSVDRSIRLANQMLTLAPVNNSAASPEIMKTVDLCRIAEEVGHALLRESRRKDQDFGLATENGPISIMGNECLLHEAVYNLVENAIRYVPAGGHITLTVCSDREWAFVSVSDNGPGMSAGEKARIGERFQRGRTATGEGAGLGLAIAKAIAERHGGRLEACDRPDRSGITFRLFIPLATQHGVDSINRSGRAAPGSED